eukprot:3192250-Rhodomonas_salina.1
MTSPLARSLGLELGHEGRHARLELLQLVAHLHRCRRIHPHPALRRHLRHSTAQRPHPHHQPLSTQLPHPHASGHRTLAAVSSGQP